MKALTAAQRAGQELSELTESVALQPRLPGGSPGLDTLLVRYRSALIGQRAWPCTEENATLRLMTRDLDLLLCGATGFTGRLAARRLARTAPSGLTLGIAGRDPQRLAALADELDGRADPIQLDLLDREAVGRAVARTRVVASTAGPFALLGDALVDACVQQRSHYVDITGETAWVRRLIDRHHARARTEGTRIVPFCGFDSVPAELGVLHLARHAHEELNDELVEVHSSYRMRGGLNGGTLATALHFAEHEDGRALHDPYLLAPEVRASDEERRRQRDPRRPMQLPPDGTWAAPFVMGAINRRVVMRSHALSGQHAPPDREGHPRSLPGYGAHFRYR